MDLSGILRSVLYVLLSKGGRRPLCYSNSAAGGGAFIWQGGEER